MDYSLIISIIGMAMMGIAAFFHTKYQSEANKQKIEEVKVEANKAFDTIKLEYEKDITEVKKENEILSKRLEASFKKLDTHGEDIRALQTEKENFLTAKDADDIYLRIKEFDRFEKHIDKRFDSIESSMGKILVKLDNL